MSSYIDQSLAPGEVLQKRFKLHWVQWIWFWVLMILGIPTIGIAFIGALIVYLRLKSQEYGVTNQRVILKTGFVSRKTDEIKLPAVETVTIEQSVFGRILGYGVVRITGRGSSGMEFKGIDDPLSVKREIEAAEASPNGQPSD